MINLDKIAKIPSAYNCTIYIRPDMFELRTGTFLIVAHCNSAEKEIGGIVVDVFNQKETEARFEFLRDICEKNFRTTDLAKRLGLDGSLA